MNQLLLRLLPWRLISGRRVSLYDLLIHKPDDTKMIALLETSSLTNTLRDVQGWVAPLWPLQDFVAVNPFVGFSSLPFLEARRVLRSFSNNETLMPAVYFQGLLADNQIHDNSLSAALDQCRPEYPDYFETLTAEQVLGAIGASSRDSANKTNHERTYFALSEVADDEGESNWSSRIIDEISRLCAAHFDQGQAIWPSPWRHLPLYSAWLQIAQIDRRMEVMGLDGFRKFVATLSDDPQQTIATLLELLNVPERHRREFLACQIASVGGWASYVKYNDAEQQAKGEPSSDLLGLIAIRLAYDFGLFDAGIAANPSQCWPNHFDSSHSRLTTPSREVLARYVLQVVVENKYRESLTAGLRQTPVPKSSMQDRKTAQLVFCIDVRSEVIRRNLESITCQVETLGFAGFFGIAMEYVPLGESRGVSQCPVLLRPTYRIGETVRGSDGQTVAKAVQRRRFNMRVGEIWKGFQNSASSCFSFVESFAPAHLMNLIRDSFGWSRSQRHNHLLQPCLDNANGFGLSASQRIGLAESILRNLSLCSGFARIIVLCGHSSDTVNNPLKAGLECGACGGHSGESNARLAAMILNDRDVRRDLPQRGISIPNDVIFMGAVHHTTTDELEFYDCDLVPAAHTAEFVELQAWARQATLLARQERSGRLRANSPSEVVLRSHDWSEVRPEWGLANNAAFIVAPRSRTGHLQLDGRAFLHNYDQHSDTEGKVLELIMTAPMLVTNWINLQYYASVVDNLHYGCGNKMLHNVVGRLGILEGTGGDLKTGLPWQSIHDGDHLQHEPLRLNVVIEASRDRIDSILDRHGSIRDLVDNGWLRLCCSDAKSHYLYQAGGDWIDC